MPDFLVTRQPRGRAFGQAVFGGNGLARRLLFTVVAFSSVVTTLITATDLYLGYRQNIDEVGKTFQLIRAGHAPAVEHSVWQLDGEEVHNELEGILRLPDIDFAGVEIDGRSRWSAGSAPSSHARELRIALVHDDARRGIQVGTLRVVANVDAAIQRVWKRALIELLSNAVKTVLVALFLLSVFQHLVTRHLEKVAGFLRGTEPAMPSRSDHRLILDRPDNPLRRRDILDDVSAAINALVTSQRHAFEQAQASQARLADSELRIRLGMEAAGYGIWDLDLAQRTAYFSPECAAIVGLQSPPVASDLSFWMDRVHPAEKPLVQAELAACMSPGNAGLRAQFRLLHQSLGWRWVVLRGRVVERDAGGNPLRALGTVVDVTTFQDMQDALRDANCDLEKRVSDRTAALEAARSEAQRANVAKSEFLARMSHELRTPLNGILGFAQILQIDESLTKAQARGIRIIEQSGRHLLTLIEDILDLARIEASRFELNPSDFDLAAFLHVVCELLRVKADEKRLAFVAMLAPGLPAFVHADEKRLRQVLLNLLSNAVKFTDAGTVRLRVTPLAMALPEPDVCIRFEVEDQGIGMDEAEVARLFTAFEQMTEMRRREGGAGLGLAISQQLVRAMGSDVQVRSVRGEGSRFWFDVKVAVRGGVAPAVSAARDAADAPRAHDFR